MKEIKKFISVLLIASMMLNSVEFAIANGLDLGTIQEDRISKKITYSDTGDDVKKDDDTPDLIEHSKEAEGDQGNQTSKQDNSNTNEEKDENKETVKNSNKKTTSDVEPTEEEEAIKKATTGKTTKQQNNNIVASKSNTIEKEYENEVAIESIIEIVATATNSDTTKNELITSISTNSNSNRLFGSTDEYILPKNWFVRSSLGNMQPRAVTTITISKAPDVAPTTYTYTYEISGSNGLQVYRNGNNITIYAPNDYPIYTAEDSSNMFDMISNSTGYGNAQLGSITGLSLLNTSRTTNMSGMFYSNRSLTSLDVSTFDTSNVTNMSEMFYYCEELTSLNLSSFNTSNVTDMSEMFYYCRKITSLNISSFDTHSVTTMNNMFAEMQQVPELDLSSFNTSAVTDMTEMFYDDRELKTIKVSKLFVTTAVTSGNDEDMFASCSKLEGGNGTTMDWAENNNYSNAYNKTYAKIDKSGQRGYFTWVDPVRITKISWDSTGVITINITFPVGDSDYTASKLRNKFTLEPGEVYSPMTGNRTYPFSYSYAIAAPFYNDRTFNIDEAHGTAEIKVDAASRFVYGPDGAPSGGTGNAWEDFKAQYGGWVMDFEFLTLFEGSSSRNYATDLDPSNSSMRKYRAKIGSDPVHKWKTDWKTSWTTWEDIPQNYNYVNLKLNAAKRIGVINSSVAWDLIQRHYNYGTDVMTLKGYSQYYNTSLGIAALSEAYDSGNAYSPGCEIIYFILDEGESIIFDGDNSKELFKDTSVYNVDWEKIGNSQQGVDNHLTSMEGWFEGVNFSNSTYMAPTEGSTVEGYNYFTTIGCGRLDMFLHMDTSNLTTTKNMFKNAIDVVTDIDPNIDINENDFTTAKISGTEIHEDTITNYYNTANLKDMSGMFENAHINFRQSRFLDILKHIVTPEVENMASMFKQTTHLFYRSSGDHTIDISHFETPNLTNISEMFRLTSFTGIIVDENIWDITNVTADADVFTNTGLVGENGSRISDGFVNNNKYAARRDTYFTPGLFCQKTGVTNYRPLRTVSFTTILKDISGNWYTAPGETGMSRGLVEIDGASHVYKSGTHIRGEDSDPMAMDSNPFQDRFRIRGYRVGDSFALYSQNGTRYDKWTFPDIGDNIFQYSDSYSTWLSKNYSETNPPVAAYEMKGYEKQDHTKLTFDEENTTFSPDFVVQQNGPTTSDNQIFMMWEQVEGMATFHSQYVLTSDKKKFYGVGGKVKPITDLRKDQIVEVSGIYYKFKYWEKQGTTGEFDFNTNITEATATFNAVWEATETVTVHFVDDEGVITGLGDVTIAKNTTVSRPENPVDGYRFSNTSYKYQFLYWHEEGYDVAFDFTTPIGHETTIKIKWQKEEAKFTVNFVTAHFGPFADQSIKYGQKAENNMGLYEGKRYKDGDKYYKFNGWFTDDNINIADKTITTETTFTARWTEETGTYVKISFNPVRGTYVINDIYITIDELRQYYDSTSGPLDMSGVEPHSGTRVIDGDHLYSFREWQDDIGGWGTSLDYWVSDVIYYWDYESDHSYFTNKVFYGGWDDVTSSYAKISYESAYGTLNPASKFIEKHNDSKIYFRDDKKNITETDREKYYQPLSPRVGDIQNIGGVDYKLVKWQWKTDWNDYDFYDIENEYLQWDWHFDSWIIFKAVWAKVEYFDVYFTNTKGVNIATQSVLVGDKARKPSQIHDYEEIVYDGVHYVFNEWRDINGNTFDFDNTVITEKTEIRGAWQDGFIYIDFVSTVNEAYKPSQIKKYDYQLPYNLPEPSSAYFTKDNTIVEVGTDKYIFKYWYSTSSTIPFAFPGAIRKDLTLTALWKKIETVTLTYTVQPYLSDSSIKLIKNGTEQWTTSREVEKDNPITGYLPIQPNIGSGGAYDDYYFIGYTYQDQNNIDYLLTDSSKFTADIYNKLISMYGSTYTFVDATTPVAFTQDTTLSAVFELKKTAQFKGTNLSNPDQVINTQNWFNSKNPSGKQLTRPSGFTDNTTLIKDTTNKRAFKFMYWYATDSNMPYDFNRREDDNIVITASLSEVQFTWTVVVDVDGDYSGLRPYRFEGIFDGSETRTFEIPDGEKIRFEYPVGARYKKLSNGSFYQLYRYERKVGTSWTALWNATNSPTINYELTITQNENLRIYFSTSVAVSNESSLIKKTFMSEFVYPPEGKTLKVRNGDKFYAPTDFLNGDRHTDTSTGKKYEFMGWYLSTDATQKIITWPQTYSGAGNQTFNASWSEIFAVDIDFEDDHRTPPASYEVESGTKISDPGTHTIGEPDIEDGGETYRFIGWYKKDTNTQFDFANEVLRGDVTLVARYQQIFKVSFDIVYVGTSYSGGTLTNPATQSIVEGNHVSNPGMVNNDTIITIGTDEYRFKYWWATSSTVPYDFTLPVNEHRRLTAYWCNLGQTKTYKFIGINPNNPDQVVKSGTWYEGDYPDGYIVSSSVRDSSNREIIKDNYSRNKNTTTKKQETFKYWYSTDSNIEFDFSVPQFDDVTLIAKWQEETIKWNVMMQIYNSYTSSNNRFEGLLDNQSSKVYEIRDGEKIRFEYPVGAWYKAVGSSYYHQLRYYQQNNSGSWTTLWDYSNSSYNTRELTITKDETIRLYFGSYAYASNLNNKTFIWGFTLPNEVIGVYSTNYYYPPTTYLVDDVYTDPSTNKTYKFLGWKESETSITILTDANWPRYENSTKTYWAAWGELVDVTFNIVHEGVAYSGGILANPATQKRAIGELATLPGEYDANTIITIGSDQYRFKYWYETDPLVPYDFSVPVDGPKNLTARWQILQNEKKYKFIGLDVNNPNVVVASGSWFESEYPSGYTISSAIKDAANVDVVKDVYTIKDIVNRQQHTFKYWYSTDSNIEFDFSVPQFDDVILIAKMESQPIKWKVTVQIYKTGYDPSNSFILRGVLDEQYQKVYEIEDGKAFRFEYAAGSYYRSVSDSPTTSWAHQLRNYRRWNGSDWEIVWAYNSETINQREIVITQDEQIRIEFNNGQSSIGDTSCQKTFVWRLDIANETIYVSNYNNYYPPTTYIVNDKHINSNDGKKYQFKGWATNSSDTTPTADAAGWPKADSARKSYYAIWTEITEKDVSYKDAYRRAPATESVVVGQHATRPTTHNPGESDITVGTDKYRFIDWYEVGATTPFDFDNTAINDNITIEARYGKVYPVSFDIVHAGVAYSGGVLTNPQTQNIVEGATVSEPTNVDTTTVITIGTTEYSFRYWWATDSNVPYDFKLPVTKKLDLTAEWKITEYINLDYIASPFSDSEIYINVGGTGDQNVLTQRIIKGYPITYYLPTQPAIGTIKNDQKLGAWKYKDEHNVEHVLNNGSTPIAFNQTATFSTVMYDKKIYQFVGINPDNPDAVLTSGEWYNCDYPGGYTISDNIKDGSNVDIVKDVYVVKNMTTRMQKAFKYWYSTDSNIEFDFSKPQTDSVVLRPKWEESKLKWNITLEIGQSEYSTPAADFVFDALLDGNYTKTYQIEDGKVFKLPYPAGAYYERKNPPSSLKWYQLAYYKRKTGVSSWTTLWQYSGTTYTTKEITVTQDETIRICLTNSESSYMYDKTFYWGPDYTTPQIPTETFKVYSSQSFYPPVAYSVNDRFTDTVTGKVYKFLGWKLNTTDTSYISWPRTKSSSEEFYAIWLEVNEKTVTFKDDYVTPPAPEVVNVGETVNRPTTHAIGEADIVVGQYTYRFIDWYATDSELPFDFAGTVINKDITIEARYRNVTQYNIGFDIKMDYEIAKKPATQSITWGNKLTTPSTIDIGYLSKQYVASVLDKVYRFNYWYSTYSNVPYDFENELVKSQFTMKASWSEVPVYDVTFDAVHTNATIINPDSQRVIRDEYASTPSNFDSNILWERKNSSNVVVEAYRFKYWYETDDTIPFDFNNIKINKTTNLKATWSTILLHTVEFTDTDGYLALSQLQSFTLPSIIEGISDGTKIATPMEISYGTVVKVGSGNYYQFNGWYDGTAKFDFENTVINKDYVLNATWTTFSGATVTFDKNGHFIGRTIPQQTVYPDVHIATPVAPNGINVGDYEENLETDGFIHRYTFVHWYLDGGDENVAYDFSVDPTSNITLIAKYSDQKYNTIKFNLNGVEVVATPSNQEKLDGELVTKPTVLTENQNYVYASHTYRFDYWYATDSTIAYNFSRPVDNNYEIKAHWTDVTPWHINYNAVHVMNPTQDTITNGNKATTPSGIDTNTVKVYTDAVSGERTAAYRFKYWYETDDTVAFDFAGTDIFRDYNLTATWSSIPLYDVTFADPDGRLVASILPSGLTVPTSKHGLYDGEKVATPTVIKENDVVKVGVGQYYKFLGWYNGTVKYDFNVGVNATVTLNARWTPFSGAIVTFDKNGHFASKTIDSQTVYPDVHITLNTTPDMINIGDYEENLGTDGFVHRYTFVHWYLDGGDENIAYDFSVDPTSNITLIAKYSDQKYNTIKFNLNGKEVVATPSDQVKLDGELVTKPTVLTENQNYVYSSHTYRFDYWYATDSTIAYNFSRPVDNNYEIKAHWTDVTPWIVTFEAGKNYTNQTKSVVNGDTATPLPAPVAGTLYEVKDAHGVRTEASKFSHWYLSTDTTKAAFDFTTPITSNITLKGEWKDIGLYSISFTDTNNVFINEDVDSSHIRRLPNQINGKIEGETVTEPTIIHINDIVRTVDNTTVPPVIQHHKFTGWYNGTNLFDFTAGLPATTTDVSITLNAKWTTLTVNIYEVTYTSPYVTPSKVKEYVEEGNTVTEPTSPVVDQEVKSGDTVYKFKYWYATDSNIPFDFSTAIHEHYDMMAKWTVARIETPKQPTPTIERKPYSPGEGGYIPSIPIDPPIINNDPEDKKEDEIKDIIEDYIVEGKIDEKITDIPDVNIDEIRKLRRLVTDSSDSSKDSLTDDPRKSWHKISRSIWYYANKNVGLLRGWHHDEQDTQFYHLDEKTGLMSVGWAKIGDYYYYFSEDPDSDNWFSVNGEWTTKNRNDISIGSMYVNRRTPDGYFVDEYGHYVESAGQIINHVKTQEEFLAEQQLTNQQEKELENVLDKNTFKEIQHIREEHANIGVMNQAMQDIQTNQNANMDQITQQALTMTPEELQAVQAEYYNQFVYQMALVERMLQGDKQAEEEYMSIINK